MKAWEHQTEGIEFIKERTGAMLAWEMGTGKSKATLDYIEDMGFNKVLIIAPQTVVRMSGPSNTRNTPAPTGT